MGGFFQQLGVQAGYNMMYQDQKALTDADLELKQQKIAENQLSIQSQKLAVEARAKITSDFASQVKDDMSAISTPENSAQQEMKKAKAFADAGLLDEAKTHEDMANHFISVAKVARDTATENMTTANETAGKAALASEADPQNPELFRAAVEAAIKSGVPSMDIPLPTDTEAVAKFYDRMKTRTQTVADTVKFKADQENKKLDREYKEKKDKEIETHRLETETQTKKHQEAEEANWKESKHLEVIRIGIEKEKLKRSSASEQMSPTELVAAGAMAAQGLPRTQIIAGMGRSTTNQWGQVRDEAIKQIMEENPSLTLKDAGTEFVNRSLKYAGAKSETSAVGRTVGAQEANVTAAASETKKMMTIVRDVLPTLDKSKYASMNAVENAVAEGSGGTEIVKLNAALNGMVNVYSRAISPKGVPTVEDKKHVREVINKAMSNGQTQAAMEVMELEMDAALASPAAARKALESVGKVGGGGASATHKPGAHTQADIDLVAKYLGTK